VAGGGDRDGFAGPVEVAGAGGGVDGGEAAGEEAGGEGCGVEEDGLALLESHLAGNAAGDDIARGELGGGVEVLHEAVAVDVEEDGAFAADGFGDEERGGVGGCGGGEGGGMELVELGVGELGSARRARAVPSPVATLGLVVWR
jgi:hypothetical protein